MTVTGGQKNGVFFSDSLAMELEIRDIPMRYVPRGLSAPRGQTEEVGFNQYHNGSLLFYLNQLEQPASHRTPGTSSLFSLRMPSPRIVGLSSRRPRNLFTCMNSSGQRHLFWDVSGFYYNLILLQLQTKMQGHLHVLSEECNVAEVYTHVSRRSESCWWLGHTKSESERKKKSETNTQVTDFYMFSLPDLENAVKAHSRDKWL